MKLDAALPPTRLADVPAIATAAEAAGFSAIWTTETQHDPFLPHALAAEHTRRILLGTGIAVSFARSPATLAYTTWDLAAQSGGRFILGLGTQVKAHIERRFGMPWPESPVAKLREQVQAIRAFWNTFQNYDKLNYRGEYYKLTLMSPFFNPGPLPPKTQLSSGLIPIYIAGVNTGLARLAGETCDGFLAHPFNSPRYLREVIQPAIAVGASAAGRKTSDVVMSVSLFAATSEKELAYCRQQISFYASTPSYKPVLELYGWGETAEKLSAHAARGEWGEMPGLVTDAMLEEFVTYAENPVALAAALKTRYTGLADRITLYLPFVPGQQDDWWQALIGEFNS